MERLKSVAKGMVGQFQDDDVPGIGAEMAYRFLFAIFPFGLFLAALVAFVAPMLGIESAPQRIIGGLGDNLPPQVADAVRPELEHVIGTTRPGLLSFGALAALWAATGGTLTLMKAMNRAYDIDESRPFLRKYLVAIGLTLLGAVGVIASFVTIVGGALLTQQLAEQLGLGDQAYMVLTLLRWPAVFVALVIAVAILYRVAPNGRVPWRWIFLGAVAFALGWLVATYAFSLYVANFGNYGATYGSLGGVIVLMLWFYLTSILLVLGGELVAVATKVYQPEALERRRAEVNQESATEHVTDTAKEALADAEDRVRDALPGLPEDPDRSHGREGDRRPDARPAGGATPGSPASVHAIRRERPED